MAITLRELIDQSADYVKADLDDDDADIIEARLTSSINGAKNIIARKHYPLYVTEDIELDTDSAFRVMDTEYTFFRLIGVTHNGVAVEPAQHAAKVYCPVGAGETVAVTYQYIPPDLKAEADACPFPAVVDFRLLCYRAAQEYYEIKGTSTSRQKAEMWRGKWNEGVSSMLTTDDLPVVGDAYGASAYMR